MSRRGSQLRILLDTSFLLPVLGFETTRRVMEAIPLLSRHELYYSELSILEALWKISKKIARLPPRERERAVRRVLEGVEAVVANMGHARLTAEAAHTALEMYWRGHRDLIDNLLYAIAAVNGLKLLTVDDQLARFVREQGLDETVITTPEQLREEEGGREKHV